MFTVDVKQQYNNTQNGQNSSFDRSESNRINVVWLLDIATAYM